MGLGAAGCADSGRFSDLTSSTNSSVPRSEAAAIGVPNASASHIDTRPLPHLASAEEGSVGRAVPPYQAAPSSAAYPPPAHSPSAVSQPRPVVAKPAARGGLVAPSVVHVVKNGETLNSIARTYHKPVTIIAKANSLSVAARLKAGDRITIPEIKQASTDPVPARTEPATPPTGSLAMAEPQHTVRIAEPAASTSGQDNVVKNAEPAGNLPGFRWPVRGRVIGAFGPKPNGVQNDGINLAVPEGTPIKAAEDGVVAYAGNELKGYGNLVLVRHSNGFVTAYAHASDILVKRGEPVKRGQVIAHAGQTGNVTSPQLHFEIRKGATPVDPAQYLSGA
jgi:murein DD-endopeptidase MepM/ murein hydrolase activator NlpD